MNNDNKIFEFIWQNELYNMYLDGNNKRFFLKVNGEGNLEYPTINELSGLIILFNDIPNVMNIIRDDNKHIVPKIIVDGTAVAITLSILLSSIGYLKEEKIADKYVRENYSISSSSNIEDNQNNTIKKQNVSVDENNKIIADTYYESSQLNYKFIYDMSYLNKAIVPNNITLEKLNDVIDKNEKISNKFKGILKEYSKAVINKYPNIDLRVFYENLKTLEVVNCTKEQLMNKSLSVDSYGCYMKNENKIYVLNDYDYVKGTWAYQVIYHELSHCLRTAYWDKNNTEIRIQFEGQNFSNMITSESLNSLFAISLFDYDEKIIAYQLQSNYNKVILECLDNYNLSDYVNHSSSYYAQKLDEYNNENNNAVKILELIQMQYDDYHSDSINVEQSNYYPIYDYICQMYYKKNINSNTSYEEAKNIATELINKITYHVPDGYKIDTNRFYSNLDNYLSMIKTQQISH